MTTIFCKTPEGLHEIETRARRISPRARATLILVDGKRSDGDLAKLVQQCDETLRSLLEAGLIEVAAKPAPKSAAVPKDPAPAETSPAEFETVRREAVRAINDLLGPQADALALKIERAADTAQLRAALERAVAYLANARGGGAAAQFAARFLNNPLV